MRKLAAIVVIGTTLILQGCASLQKYPAFSAQPGGRLITADRSGVTNLLPATKSAPAAHPTPPTTYGDPVH
ncbi:MAG TPA: hypothetical protein VL693_22630 [Vicinamibacterales bacterium]|jgi:hypothetical protein|nr:hypothetical protein [Vicinamibacterales bacterium]